MQIKQKPKSDPPTALFFDFEHAILKGDWKAADAAAEKLRRAGYFVRRLPGKRGGVQMTLTHPPDAERASIPSVIAAPIASMLDDEDFRHSLHRRFWPSLHAAPPSPTPYIPL